MKNKHFCRLNFHCSHQFNEGFWSSSSISSVFGTMRSIDAIKRRISLSSLMNQSLSAIIVTSLNGFSVVTTRPNFHLNWLTTSDWFLNRGKHLRALKISAALDGDSYWGLPTCYTCVAVHIGREINLWFGNLEISREACFDLKRFTSLIGQVKAEDVWLHWISGIVGWTLIDETWNLNWL